MSCPLREKLGICQWFHFKTYDEVERALGYSRDLGLKHLRTGVSWADFHRPGGKSWYDWKLRTLKAAGLEVLLSVWHTPPSLAEGGSCAGPPRELKDYANFIDLVIGEYGGCFSALELWNEPNNRLKWDFVNFDPAWRKFGWMVGMAAHWARYRGKTTVLGGMIPVDPQWLKLMKDYGTLEQINVVAIHGFPGMWWPEAPNWDWYSHWQGWADKVSALSEHAEDRPIWITETGLATWDLARQRADKHDLQVEMLQEAAAAPAERVYWYSLVDLHPSREAIEGFHVDENEYHLGLVTYKGEKKPAYYRFKELLSMAPALLCKLYAVSSTWFSGAHPGLA